MKRVHPLLTAALFLGAANACSRDVVSPGGGSGAVSLSAPLAVDAVATSPTSVRIVYQPLDAADDYVIQRSGSDGNFKAVGTTGADQFDDTGLSPGVTYHYRVAGRSQQQQGAFSQGVAATTYDRGSQVAVLTGRIRSSRTVGPDSTWVISGTADVENGATLTILPGTQLVGDSSRPWSTLVITRGAKIDARGAADNPIVFTSQHAPGDRMPGDWGGIAIVGNARTNLAGDRFTDGHDRTFNYGGGGNDADNSGVLRYVRIEFAGHAYATGVEANSLTLYAVGRGTTIEYVQVLGGLDDHFKFLGGTVNSRYLVSYDAGGNHFDFGQGFTGHLQNVIALQTRRVTGRPGSGDAPGSLSAFESDGCESDLIACGDVHASPYTMPTVANFSIVGAPKSALGDATEFGLRARRGSAGTYVNGIIARIPDRGISVEDSFSDTLRARDSLTIRNVLVSDTPTLFDPDQSSSYGQRSKFSASGIEETSASAASLFVYLPAAPTTSTLDWTPSSQSPANSGGLSTFGGVVAARTAGVVSPTTYRGAVDPFGSRWWTGWTVFVGG